MGTPRAPTKYTKRFWTIYLFIKGNILRIWLYLIFLLQSKSVMHWNLKFQNTNWIPLKKFSTSEWRVLYYLYLDLVTSFLLSLSWHFNHWCCQPSSVDHSILQGISNWTLFNLKLCCGLWRSWLNILRYHTISKCLYINLSAFLHLSVIFFYNLSQDHNILFKLIAN